MEVLSTTNGSAQAIREAAEASAAGGDSRLGLERELDRLNAGLASHADALAQHLNWTLLAQAFLVTTYFIVLVGGWSVPLPGKRLLLASIAGYGAVSLVLGYLSLRAHRDRIAPLRQSRRLTEQALERVASRPPVFSREQLLSATVGAWASRLLPIVILAGWGMLTVYTLALPLPTDGRVARDARGEAKSATAAGGPARARAPAPARKAEQAPAPGAADVATEAADDESGLAAMFRRAINSAQTDQREAAPAEAVKP
jgi:hypothetical protein